MVTELIPVVQITYVYTEIQAFHKNVILLGYVYRFHILIAFITRSNRRENRAISIVYA
jgi:hypothetical protein